MSNICKLCTASHPIQEQVKKWHFFNKKKKNLSEISRLLRSKYDLVISYKSVERHLTNHVQPELEQGSDFLTAEHKKEIQSRSRPEKLKSGLLAPIYERFDADEHNQGDHVRYQHFPHPLTSSPTTQDLNPLFISLFQKILLLSHEALASQQAQTGTSKTLLDLSTALETFVSAFHKLEKTEHTNASEHPQDSGAGSQLSSQQISQIYHILNPDKTETQNTPDEDEDEDDGEDDEDEEDDNYS